MCRWRGRELAVVAVASLGFAGCVGPGAVRQAELAAFEVTDTVLPTRYYTLHNFDDVLKYGVNLTHSYMALSDRAAAFQDIAALGIIGSAGSAAAAFVYGPYTDVIAGAGLAAGMISATRNYSRPEENGEAFLATAEETNCIVRAGHRTKDLDDDYETIKSYDNLRIEIVVNGLTRAQVKLRARLARGTFPSYGDLVNELRQAAKTEMEADEADARAAFTRDPEAELRADVARLRANVDECLVST